MILSMLLCTKSVQFSANIHSATTYRAPPTCQAICHGVEKEKGIGIKERQRLQRKATCGKASEAGRITEFFLEAAARQGDSLDYLYLINMHF